MEIKLKLAQLAKDNVNPVVMTDNQGRITWVNQAFTKVTEFEPGEIIGRKPGSFLQGTDTDRSSVGYMREQIGKKMAFNCEIINYSKSGRKYGVRIQGQPLFDVNGEVYGFFAIETEIGQQILPGYNSIGQKLIEQRQMSRAMLECQEDERDVLWQELQNNIAQMLACAKLYMEMALTDEGNRELGLKLASTSINQVIQKVRNLSKSLSSPKTHALGLIECIRAAIDDLVVAQPISVDLRVDRIAEGELSDRLQVDIYRIVQEQLNNVLRHSSVTRVLIDLSCTDEEIAVFIADNGRVMDLAAEVDDCGMMNLRTRADAHSGYVEMSSQLGEGYRFKAVLKLSASNQ